MSIIVKNLEVPETCVWCYFYDKVNFYCEATRRRIYKIDNPKPKWCPIEEVKENEK